jgi:hypothetical protein
MLRNIPQMFPIIIKNVLKRPTKFSLQLETRRIAYQSHFVLESNEPYNGTGRLPDLPVVGTTVKFPVSAPCRHPRSRRPPPSSRQ